MTKSSMHKILKLQVETMLLYLLFIIITLGFLLCRSYYFVSGNVTERLFLNNVDTRHAVIQIPQNFFHAINNLTGIDGVFSVQDLLGLSFYSNYGSVTIPTNTSIQRHSRSSCPITISDNVDSILSLTQNDEQMKIKRDERLRNSISVCKNFPTNELEISRLSLYPPTIYAGLLVHLLVEGKLHKDIHNGRIMLSCIIGGILPIMEQCSLSESTNLPITHGPFKKLVSLTIPKTVPPGFIYGEIKIFDEHEEELLCLQLKVRIEVKPLGNLSNKILDYGL